MRDDFTKKTKETLAKRVGYKCSNPNCNKLTSGPNDDDNKSTSIGVAAHLSGASKGGPRYSKDLTPEERKDINNGIWLCHNCSVLIDKDKSKYSIELLKSWKEKAEKKAYVEISAININAQSANNNFQSLFFELLNQQEKILEGLEVITKKTKGGKVLSQEKIIGRKAIRSYYEVFGVPFKKYQSNDPQLPKEMIPQKCAEFFSSTPELVNLFKFNKQILTFLQSNSSMNNIEFYLNIFLTKFDYYEKIMLFYYLLETKDEDYLKLVKEYKILEGIKAKDLMHNETYNLI